MGRSADILVENVEASRRALAKIFEAERSAVVGTLDRIGEQGVTEVKRQVTAQRLIKTGTLHRSWTYEIGRARPDAAYVEISSNVVYAPYHEFGTVRMPARPTLRPGIDALIRKIPQVIATDVGAAGRRAAPTGVGGLARAASRLGG